MILQSDNKIFFREVQQFRQGWLWAIILPCSLFCWIWIVSILGKHPSALSWFVWFLVGICLPSLFYFLKVITEVNAHEISVKFFPVTRIYPLPDVLEYTAKKYEPPYPGGWGLGPGFITVSSHWGVELKFKNGEKILIGSQHTEEFWEAIRVAMEQFPGEENVDPYKQSPKVR